MDKDTDKRVVDRTQLGDRLIGTSQISLHEIRRSSQFLESRDQLAGGFA